MLEVESSEQKEGTARYISLEYDVTGNNSADNFQNSSKEDSLSSLSSNDLGFQQADGIKDTISTKQTNYVQLDFGR